MSNSITLIHPDHAPADGKTFSIDQIERATWAHGADKGCFDVLRIHPTELGALAMVEPLRNGKFTVMIGSDGERLDGEHASSRIARFVAIAHLVSCAAAQDRKEIEAIRRKPIVELTDAEIGRLSPVEQRRVIGFLAHPATKWDLDKIARDARAES